MNRTRLYLLGIKQLTALYPALDRAGFGRTLPPQELASRKSRFIPFMWADSDSNARGFCSHSTV